MEKAIEIVRVAWYSPMDLPEPKESFGNIKLIRVDNFGDIYPNFDVFVFDVVNFESLEALKLVYAAFRLPTVIVVDTIEQESTVLAWLEIGDDICRREAIEGQLALRLRRTNLKHLCSLNLDPLTGVAYRRRLDDYARKWFLSADRDRDQICLILLDIDHFKQINHKYGQSVGDRILQELGRLLRQAAFGSGIVARYGGEEFAIFMPDTIEQGKALAEFLRTEIEKSEFTEQRIRVTASFGVAVASGDSSWEKLQEGANSCLYSAKNRGRDQVVIDREYNQSLNDEDDRSFVDFENRIQVMADRMASALTLSAFKLAERYREEAVRDRLTGLFNRRYLDRFLAREWEKSEQNARPLTVALLDLDRFGEINKTYGFPTGDRSLKTTAAVLLENVRAGDWVARFGGEEFCIVMPDTPLSGGCLVAERVRRALADKTVMAYSGQPFRVTASFGVVERGEGDSAPEAFWQRIGDRVRDAKQGGRNQVRF